MKRALIAATVVAAVGAWSGVVAGDRLEVGEIASRYGLVNPDRTSVPHPTAIVVGPGG